MGIRLDQPMRAEGQLCDGEQVGHEHGSASPGAATAASTQRQWMSTGGQLGSSDGSGASWPSRSEMPRMTLIATVASANET